MYKILIVMGIEGKDGVSSQIVEFRFKEEADKAAENIVRDSYRSLYKWVIKLY